MIYKKLVVFILILISIFSLANYEMLFYKRQKLLILESNSLLSPRNVLANESIKHSWRSDQKPKDKFTIYGIIERSSNQTVIGFYTTDYTKINLPIKNGSFFSIEDSKEAIVGKDIPIYYKNDVAYFDYGNIPYKVVGELGISKESPLRKYVLINDLKLLERDYVPLIDRKSVV